MPEKNQQFITVITDVTSEGSGVCRVDDMAVFVPGTAVGDEIEGKIVKVLKNYAFGIVEKILTPSPDRITADCEYYKKCGGCVFRHISYEAECKIKQNIVENAFARIGGLSPEFEEFLPCDNISGYRNKAQYPIAMLDGKAICGFYSPRSHRVVPISNCKLQPPVFQEIADAILNYINKNNISVYNEVSNTGIARHIYIRQAFYSKEIMVCLVVRKNISRQLKTLCDILTQKFSNIKSIVINVNPDKTNVILGKNCYTIWGNDVITDTMCGNKIEISPQSFYQVNTPQAEKLYSIAKKFAQPNGKNIVDLYCGAGTIGLSMADVAESLIGIEIVPQAVQNAKRNSNLNSINAEFICDDAGSAFSSLTSKLNSLDILLLDPPRKGCDSLALNAILKASPNAIVMISCNPSTAARDCKFLCQNGYSLQKIQAVDLFPRTGHVETVVLLSKLKSSQHIEVKIELDEADITAAESN